MIRKELSKFEKTIANLCIWSLRKHDFLVFWVGTMSGFIGSALIFLLFIDKMTTTIGILGISFLLLILFLILARWKYLNKIKDYPEAKEAYEAMLELIKKRGYIKK